MATVRPFAALRPKPGLADLICELPYDVMSSDEARRMAADNPFSFLHVSKPEIDLPSGTDPYAPEVYARGRQNFQQLIAQGTLRQDQQPCFYLYRQVMGQHAQVGIVGVASCREYLEGTIKKHELTRPDKEDDRVRHIEALAAQTGPVFLVFRSNAAIDEFVGRQVSEVPEVDFVAKDGVRHSSWVVARKADILLLESEFGRMPALYIADGHHRSAAAARVSQARRGAGNSGFFLSVLFPQDQVQILPYNRVLKDLNGLSPEQLLEALGRVLEVHPNASHSPSPAPRGKHQLSMYLSGRWHSLSFRAEAAGAADPASTLDVAMLQRKVLEPIFGIADPRTSKRINFVGGIRGSAELEHLVDKGEYACAFAMFPTGIEELMAIADAGGIMPPKSTWFEPKLRDAMFCHLL